MPDSQIQCSIDGLPFTPLHLAGHLHAPRGGRPRLPGPGDRRRSGIPQLVPTLYEWEVILPPDVDAARHHDHQAARRPLTGQLHQLLRVHRQRRPDRTRSSWSSSARSTAGRSSPATTPEEVEVLTAGAHTLEVRAVDETGNADPTPAVRDLDRRRHLGARHLDRLRARTPRPPRRRATFEFTGEEETGDAGVRVRVRARQRRVRRLLRAAVHGHRPDRRPARHVRARQGPGRQRRPDAGLLRVAGHRAGRHDAARHVHRLRPGRGRRSGPDVLFGFLSNEPVEEFECSLDGGAVRGLRGPCTS